MASIMDLQTLARNLVYGVGNVALGLFYDKKTGNILPYSPVANYVRETDINDPKSGDKFFSNPDNIMAIAGMTGSVGPMLKRSLVRPDEFDAALDLIKGPVERMESMSLNDVMQKYDLIDKVKQQQLTQQELANLSADKIIELVQKRLRAYE